MNYRYLLIDLDDTLLDWHETERQGLFAVIRERFGRELTAEEVRTYNEINAQCWKLLERKEITKDRLKMKRFTEFLASLGVASDEETVRDVNQRYMRMISRTVVEFPDAARVCRALAEKYKLFLITNGTDWVQRERLSRMSFTDAFTGIVISDEIGCNKPDPAFFRGVTDMTCDPNPAHYLVIGDSFTSDIAFGRAIGADTVWVQTRNEEQPGAATYKVRAIGELLPLLLE